MSRTPILYLLVRRLWIFSSRTIIALCSLQHWFWSLIGLIGLGFFPRRLDSSIWRRYWSWLERGSSLSEEFVVIRGSSAGCSRLSAIVLLRWVPVHVHRLVANCWSVAHKRRVTVLYRRFLSQELGLSRGRVTLRSRRHVRGVWRLSWVVLLRPMLLLLKADSRHGHYQDGSSLLKGWSSSCVCG